MMKAITFTDGTKVHVHFRSIFEHRLTPAGFEDVQVIDCTLFTDDMQTLGHGVAVRAPEDAPNDNLGMFISLERAMEQAYPTFEIHEIRKRMKLRQLLGHAIGQIEEEEEREREIAERVAQFRRKVEDELGVK